MKRPTIDKAMILVAAEQVAAELGDGADAQTIAGIYRPHMDGYELARQLDRYCGWDFTMSEVETLDTMTGIVMGLQRDAEKTWAAAWKAAKRHRPHPAPSVPECPYPCGWQNLLKHALVDGSFLARSINEDEPVTENGRAVTMRMVMRLRDVLMAINNAAPETKP